MLSPETREHRRVVHREWRKNNPTTARDWAVLCFYGIVKRSKKRGWSMPTFTADYVLEVVERAEWRCECCHAVTERGGSGRTGPHRTSPTIDCVDPRGPYAVGGIALLCHRCNSTKSDALPTELERIAAWMRQRGVSGDLDA